MTMKQWPMLKVGCDSDGPDGMGCLEIVTDDALYNTVAEVLGDYNTETDEDELTDEIRAFAERLVIAWNAHAALVEACGDAWRSLERVAGDPTRRACDEAMRVAKHVRAALALAREEDQSCPK